MDPVDALTTPALTNVDDLEAVHIKRIDDLSGHDMIVSKSMSMPIIFFNMAKITNVITKSTKA